MLLIITFCLMLESPLLAAIKCNYLLLLVLVLLQFFCDLDHAAVEKRSAGEKPEYLR